jgi:biotin carboxylase
VANLLFLGASISQVPAIRHARAAGHRVVAVDADPAAVGFEIADRCVNVDFAHIAEVVAAGAVHNVDGVLAVSSDRAVLPAAAIADALGLPGIGIEVAHSMTDKPTMRARFAHAGVPQPRGTVVTPDSNLDGALDGLHLPAVLKPADSGGQRGIFLVRGRGDLDAHLEETLAFSATSRAMLEEFVDGTELNGILVVRDGEPTLITLSDRLRPPGPGFGVGWAHVYPSRLPARVLERARDVAFDAVRVLGLQDAVAFPQLIASGEDVRVIEIAARIAAGQMADLVRFATGIELFDVAIAQALGEPVPDELVTPTTERPVAIRFLTAAPGVLPLGTVTRIDRLDQVRSSPGVLAAGLYFDAGTTITPVQVDADRRGYVAATAENPDRALELADEACEKLDVRTLRPVVPAGRRRLVLSGAGALAAVAVVLILVAFTGGLRPRLVSDTISATAGRLHVHYAFNEPVRAELLVHGRPATALTSLSRSGELSWRAHGGAAASLAIEGIDPRGRHAVFSVKIPAPAAARERHHGAG